MKALLDQIDWMYTLRALDEHFNGVRLSLLLYLIALVVLIFVGKKKSKEIFVWPVILAIFTVFNPVIMSLIADKIGLAVRLKRIYFILPVAILIAYMAVSLINKFESKKIQALVATCSAVLLASMLLISNTTVYGHVFGNITSNFSKMDQVVVEMDNLIHENIDSETANVMYTDSEFFEMHTYDPTINWRSSRYYILDWRIDIAEGEDYEEAINRCLESGDRRGALTFVGYTGFTPDSTLYLDALQSEQIDFIIISEGSNLRGYYDQIGLQMIEQVGNFLLYKV